jgi:hypothetical protein
MAIILFVSGVGGYGGKGRGTRIAKNPKTVEDAAFIRVPEDRDMNGHARTRIQKRKYRDTNPIHGIRRENIMTLSERIRRGEAAIAAAKAQGRDVARWEEHLTKRKREVELQQLAETVLPESLPDEVNSTLKVCVDGTQVCRKA